MFRGVPELDLYMKELLVENNKIISLHIEKLLKINQTSFMEILGPWYNKVIWTNCYADISDQFENSSAEKTERSVYVTWLPHKGK